MTNTTTAQAEYLTVIYKVRPGQEAVDLLADRDWCFAGWCHAIEERDAARAALAAPAPALDAPADEKAQRRPVEKLEPGSDIHLCLLGAPWHFNMLRGKEFSDVMAFGRAVWEAARASQPTPAQDAAATVPSYGAVAAKFRSNCVGDACDFSESTSVVTVDEAVRVARLFAATQAAPTAAQPVAYYAREGVRWHFELCLPDSDDNRAGLDWRPLVEPIAAPTTPQAPALVPLTDAQIEAGREATFSVNNPFCPCDRKTMQKAVRWAERKHGIGITPTTKEQQ